MTRRLSFRDRFFTPPVARAMLSPSGILLAGAGAAVAIATGLPLIAAPVIGVLAWATRVGVAIPRPGKGDRIDPFTLNDPWRHYVQSAVDAQHRYERAVSGAASGPLKSRLREIGDRIGDGVEQCWRVARRGQQLVDARRDIDTDAATRQLQAIGDATDASSPSARTADALRSQLATAARMDAVINDTYSKLQLLDARLDESVARALELSVQEDDSALATLGADVDGVVTEMEALRQALEETNSSPAAGTA